MSRINAAQARLRVPGNLKARLNARRYKLVVLPAFGLLANGKALRGAAWTRSATPASADWSRDDRRVRDAAPIRSPSASARHPPTAVALSFCPTPPHQRCSNRRIGTPAHLASLAWAAV